MSGITVGRSGHTVSVGYLGSEVPEAARDSREVESMILSTREANEVAASISAHLKGMKHRLLGLSEPQEAAAQKPEVSPVHCDLKEMRLALDTLKGYLNDILSDVHELDRI